MACSWRKPAHALVDSYQEWLARDSHRKSGGHARRRPRRTRHSPGAGAVAALQLEGTCLPMMYDVNLAVMAAAAGVAILAAVYLWSKDPARRDRAWRLLKLLLHR